MTPEARAALVEQLRHEADRCLSIAAAVSERMTFGHDGPWEYKANLMRQAADALADLSEPEPPSDTTLNALDRIINALEDVTLDVGDRVYVAVTIAHAERRRWSAQHGTDRSGPSEGGGGGELFG